MKPILLSFLAFNNDFLKDESGQMQFKETGPHGTLWKTVLNSYEHHYLFLSYSDQPDQQSPEQVRKTNELKKFLDKFEYSNKISIEYLPELSEEIINVNKIKQVLSFFIEGQISNRKEVFEAFISPGTPAMQLAWLLIGLDGLVNLKTFQTKEEKFRKDKNRDLREYTELEKLPITTGLIQRDRSENAKDPNDYKIYLSKQEAYNRAKQIAKVPKLNPTLIIGETGSGKENLAKHIHKESNNSSKPFLDVNCGAFNENTLMAELFGYRKGAFTGASSEGKSGYLKDTKGGTLFLDEIGEMNPSMQTAMLRVLQEGKFTPMGETKEEVFTGRIIAATHRNLKQMCEEGKFRWDLYYRLSSAVIKVPSLNQWRIEDKRELINEESKKICNENGRVTKLKFEERAYDILLNYHFPGNIRELKNILTSLYIFHYEQEISTSILAEYLNESKFITWRIDEVLHNHALKALDFFGGNKERTRKELGIAKNTLDKYLKGNEE